MKQPFRKKSLCILVGSVLMGTGGGMRLALADDAAPPANPGQLDSIVVTASSQKKSVLESSLSVTDVSSQLVEDLAPTSVAETLRLIPGIIPSQGSPGGNANIAVRGLPVPTGGGTFVQIQEDGLPTVLFGDMQFGNNDYWTKFDHSETIQAVRGGSASTLASQAPGAVINYISDTGTRKGGEVTLSAGLNYNEQKADFAVGGPIADGWRFHADGYLKQGNGIQDPGFQVEKGYQIKANVTHDLDDGKGYIRAYLKLLDDQEPYQNAAPIRVTSNGTTVTSAGNVPGYSAGTFSTVGPGSQTFSVASLYSGQLQQEQANGLHPVAHALGAELHFLPGDGWIIDDKWRYTDMSGTFSTYFPNVAPASSYIGSAIGGANGSGLTVGKFIFNNGSPLAPNTLLTNNVQVFTNVSDAGSLANDFSMSNKFSLIGKKDLSATAGVFYMNQHYTADWHPNYTFLTFGPQGVPVNPVATNGTLLALNGVSGYNTNWGAGTARQYTIEEPDTAPYLNLSWDIGSLSIDGGLRRDILRQTGTFEAGSAINSLTGTTSINGTTYPYSVGITTLDPSTTTPINVGMAYNSWSLGALYLLNDNNSVFARASRGGRATFDRLMPTSLVNTISGAYNGPQSNLISTVLQQEVGVKSEGDFADGAWGKYAVEFTIFHDSFGNSNSDLTKCGPAGAPNDCGLSQISQYSARGFEFDGHYSVGGFGLIAQVTYSDASIDAASLCYPVSGCSSGQTGIQPGGVPSVTYMLSPSYRTGPYYGALVITGANATPSNQGSYDFWLPPYTLVSAVGSYALNPSTIFAVHANNLFNSLAVTGVNSVGVGTYNTTGTVALARSVIGSVTFKF